jgi:hypothetical protein
MIVEADDMRRFLKNLIGFPIALVLLLGARQLFLAYERYFEMPSTLALAAAVATYVFAIGLLLYVVAQVWSPQKPPENSN